MLLSSFPEAAGSAASKDQNRTYQSSVHVMTASPEGSHARLYVASQSQSSPSGAAARRWAGGRVATRPHDASSNTSVSGMSPSPATATNATGCLETRRGGRAPTR